VIHTLSKWLFIFTNGCTIYLFSSH